MVKVARTGPRISQKRLLAIVAALILAATLISSAIEGRRIANWIEFCAQYGAVYDGVGCAKNKADF